MNTTHEREVDRQLREKPFQQPQDVITHSIDAATAVRSLRRRMLMSRKDFAMFVGKSISQIERIENHRAFPTTKILKDIAEATNQHLSISFDPIVKTDF